jgi:hypothetical protein
MGPSRGAINQTVNLQTQQGIDSHGGWGEVAWYWTAKAHSHAGYGKDIARRAQLAPGAFTTNATAFVNLFYDQSPMVRFGVEGTWRKTEYLGLPGNSGYALMLMSEFRF